MNLGIVVLEYTIRKEKNPLVNLVIQYIQDSADFLFLDLIN